DRVPTTFAKAGLEDLAAYPGPAVRRTVRQLAAQLLVHAMHEVEARFVLALPHLVLVHPCFHRRLVKVEALRRSEVALSLRGGQWTGRRSARALLEFLSEYSGRKGCPHRETGAQLWIVVRMVDDQHAPFFRTSLTDHAEPFPPLTGEKFCPG